MPNAYFQMKQFTVFHDRCAMKVTTDACLFGAWVADQLQGEPAGNVLDVGAGSGLLSLMIAQKSGSLIDAVELDPDAGAQAAENFTASPWKERLQSITADIRDYAPGRQYGVIVSNPPFYENLLSSADEARNLAHHSSALSLQELLHNIRRLLAPGGRFFLLLPFRRQAEAAAVIGSAGLFLHQHITVRPVESRPPFRLLLSGGTAPVEKRREEEWVIQQATGHYTHRFTDLLEAYYLYL